MVPAVVCAAAVGSVQQDPLSLYPSQELEIPAGVQPGAAVQAARAVERIPRPAAAPQVLDGDHRVRLCECAIPAPRGGASSSATNTSRRSNGSRPSRGSRPNSRSKRSSSMDWSGCCSMNWGTRSTTCSTFRCSSARKTPPTRSRPSSPCSSVRRGANDRQRQCLRLQGLVRVRGSRLFRRARYRTPALLQFALHRPWQRAS